MAIVRICAEEIMTLDQTYSETITCDHPAHTPTGAGDECNVVVYNAALDLGATPPTLCFSYDSQFEYEYEHLGSTFMDYCSVIDQTACITLPDEVKTCCCGITPTLTYSSTASPGSITTTPTSVTGVIDVSFTVSNLCVPTAFCVSTVDCP